MVTNMKGAGRDECQRQDFLSKKLEVGQVYQVWTHNQHDDYNWQVCDVIVQDAIPLEGQPISPKGPLTRWRVPVLQKHIGQYSGTPWTPRVGDTVLVGFYQNDRPIILGTLPPECMWPVCRSSANPGQLPKGAHEDWVEADFHNLYDHRIKLVQWLHIPRRFLKAADGMQGNEDGDRGWYTTFDHCAVDPTGYLRPVCLSYFDKTRDFMMVWECKEGKAKPDCKDCELNWDNTGKGPDNICECTECSGDRPAMNAFLKILSSDYQGDCSGQCAADLPRRFKYHHPCGSLFCMDSNFPANDVFEACDKHRGRIWLQSKETTCAVGTQLPLGHLHFRAEANKDGDIYPDTPQGYGKFNVSLRSYDTFGAHLEMWGKGNRRGRWDLANEEMGKVQEEDDHCGTGDAHVTCKETTGIIQIHSLATGGKIYEMATGDILIKSCSGTVTIKAGTIVLDGDVQITGNNQIAGTCGHGPCSCDGSCVKIDAVSGNCMKREPTGEWACLGNKVLTSVCCQNANNIIGCNSAGECWMWDGDKWTLISTSPSMKYISIGCDGSTIGRATSTASANIYMLVDEAWVAFYNGTFDRIASYSTTLHYLTGNNSKKLYIGNGSTFAAPGDTTALTDISVAKDGSLFGIKQSDGSLIKWSHGGWGSSLGASTGLKAIAAKSATMVWAIGSDDKLYYWNGLTWTKSSDDTVSGIALAMM